MPSLHEVVAIIINSQDVPVTWGREMCVLAKCLCYKALIFIVSLAPPKAIFFQTCLLELQFLDFMADCFVTSGGIYAPAMTFKHEPVLACFTRLSSAKAQMTQPTSSSVVYVAVSFQNSKSSHFVCFMFRAKGGPGSEDEKKKIE